MIYFLYNFFLVDFNFIGRISIRSSVIFFILYSYYIIIIIII